MLRQLALISLFLAALLPGGVTFAAEDFKEITWEALVPKGWDPSKDLKSMDLSKLSDNDPRAVEALEKIKNMWENAPTEPSLQNTRIKLPGFAIPLEKKGDKVIEFLLVPYFGACIHTPPPPSNQIVHIISKKPLADLNTMDPVWVSGTITLHSKKNPWGAAGYVVNVDKVEPYKPPYRGSRVDLFGGK